MGETSAAGPLIVLSMYLLSTYGSSPRSERVSGRPARAHTMTEDESVPPGTKQVIADAVRSALAAHGYANLTTSRVATECPKSEAFLFYHYDTKDELVAAFLESSTGWIAEELAKVEAESATAELLAVCDRLVPDPEDPESAGLAIGIMELLSHAPHNETLREPLRAHEVGVHETVTGIVREGVAAGEFRDVDPEATAALLVAAAEGSTGFGLALDRPETVEQVRERLQDYVRSEIVREGQSEGSGCASTGRSG